MITTEPGDSLKIRFDFDKLTCFHGAPEYLFNTVNGFLNELFQFACVCLNDWFDWLASFFRFSKVESDSTFFHHNLC